MINAATALLITAEQNALQRSRVSPPPGPEVPDRGEHVVSMEDDSLVLVDESPRPRGISVEELSRPLPEPEPERAYAWDGTPRQDAPVSHATVRRDGTVQINVDINSESFQQAAENLAAAMRRLTNAFTSAPPRGPIQFPEGTNLAPEMDVRL